MSARADLYTNIDYPPRQCSFKCPLRHIQRNFQITHIEENLKPLQESSDLLPPSSHACLYEIDFWLNDGFRAALAASDVPPGQDTDFDWMLHMALLKIGDDDFTA